MLAAVVALGAFGDKPEGQLGRWGPDPTGHLSK